MNMQVFMKRTFLSTALFLASLSLSGHSSAIGLGDANLKSWLGQPLDVLIPLTDTVGVNKGDILVRQIYGQSARKLNFEDAIDSPRYIISTKVDNKGQLWVKANTRHTVTDPYISFVLQVEMKGGTVNREYTLLMDMPPSNNTTRNSNPTRPLKNDPLAPVFPSDNGLSAKFSHKPKNTPQLSIVSQSSLSSNDNSVNSNTAQKIGTSVATIDTPKKNADVVLQDPIQDIQAPVKPLSHLDNSAIEHDDTKKKIPSSTVEQPKKAVSTAIPQEVAVTKVLDEDAKFIPAATSTQKTASTNATLDNTNYLYFLVAALLLLASALLAKIYWPQLYRRKENQTQVTDSTQSLDTSSSENFAADSTGNIQIEHEFINLEAPDVDNQNSVLATSAEDSLLNEPLLEDFDIGELNNSLLEGSDIGDLDFGFDIENNPVTESPANEALSKDADSDVIINCQDSESIDVTTDINQKLSDHRDLDPLSNNAEMNNIGKSTKQRQSLGQAAESEQNFKDKELHKKLAERKLEINNDHPTFTPSDIDSGHVMLDESYQPEELDSFNASESIHTDAESDTIWQANIYAAYGQHDRSEKLLDQGLKESPDSVALKLALADIYARSGQHDEFELMCKNIPQDEENAHNSITEWRKQFNIGPK